MSLFFFFNYTLSLPIFFFFIFYLFHLVRDSLFIFVFSHDPLFFPFHGHSSCRVLSLSFFFFFPLPRSFVLAPQGHRIKSVTDSHFLSSPCYPSPATSFSSLHFLSSSFLFSFLSLTPTRALHLLIIMTYLRVPILFYSPRFRLFVSQGVYNFLSFSRLLTHYIFFSVFFLRFNFFHPVF